jgi:hypothetical protein
MTTTLEAARKSLEGRIPEGYDLANLVLVDVSGQASLEEVSDADWAEARKSMNKAEMPVIDDRGRPTRITIDAWMAHSDVANRNGQYFMADDLKSQHEVLGAAPDFLVMDWNHSAVMGEERGPKVIGSWYHVSYEHDAAANGGKGAMGLRAQGMMWAWLFPEQANILLGEQARNGYAAFSMAAIAKRKSFMEDQNTGRSVTVLHEPVFFTLSALDVQPADPDARGIVSLAHDTVVAPAIAQISEDTSMTPEEIATLKASLETAKAEAATLKAQLIEKEAAAIAAAAAAEVAATKISELETSLVEAASAREAFVAERAAELADLTATHEALVASHTEVLAELEILKAEKNAAEVAKVLASRLEALPESFRKAHAAREDEQRVRVETKWMTMSDEQWEEYLATELLFGFERASFQDRSISEGGRLPTGGTTDAGELKARATRITK